MLYKVKHFLQYRIKQLETYFETLKTHREIVRAYRSEKRAQIQRLHFNRKVILGTGGGIFLALVIILVIVNLNKIIMFFPKPKIVTRESVTQPEPVKSKDTITRKPVTKNPDTVVLTSVPETSTVPREIPEPRSIDSTMLMVQYEAQKLIPIPRAMNYLILANKANKKMYILIRKSGSWSIFYTFNMAIGENQGRKFKTGDKKTPEGLYFIIGRKEKSELTRKYGPLAYVLNYPNNEDKQMGRTGYGIWIHGTNPDSLPVQTQGCLELNNRNLISLAKLLKTGIGTPVSIINQPSLSDPVTFLDYASILAERKKILTEYTEQRNILLTLLKTWENAWESRDINTYSGFYETATFRGQGISWNQWKKKKKRTFEIYDDINISIDNIFLADYSESTAVIKFIQGYKSDKLDVINGKKLDFVKNDGKWKIGKENTFPKEELLL